MTNAAINIIEQALSRAQWTILCAGTPQDGLTTEHYLTRAAHSISDCITLIGELPAEETELHRITLWSLIQQWGEMDDLLSGRAPALASPPASAPSVEELDVVWEDK
jgi:hypothetical protein